MQVTKYYWKDTSNVNHLPRALLGLKGNLKTAAIQSKKKNGKHRTTFSSVESIKYGGSLEV